MIWVPSVNVSFASEAEKIDSVRKAFEPRRGDEVTKADAAVSNEKQDGDGEQRGAGGGEQREAGGGEQRGAGGGEQRATQAAVENDATTARGGERRADTRRQMNADNK